MTFHSHHLLPLLAACLYPLAALLTKRAFDKGIGFARNLFLANWIMVLCFLPMTLFGEPPRWDVWFGPVIASLLFFLGQLFGFFAIRFGDISVATPVMGTKTIFVALGVTLFSGAQVRPLVWFAALLAAAAIFLLGAGDIRSNRGTSFALVCALISAAMFGLCDACVQKWALAFSPTWFIPAVFVLAATWSFALIPFFSAPIRSVPSAAWPWLISGSVVMASQALLLVLALAYFDDTTEINILYATRGLWSIALVFLLGPWLGNTESQRPTHVMVLRTLGALLLCSSVFLIYA